MKGRGVFVFVCVAAVSCLLGSPLVAEDVTTRISVSSTGAQIPLPSWRPSMSGDGRLVAFQSLADNVVMTDSNSVYDIYVLDRVFGSSRIASRSTAGALADRQSLYPSFSRDGRFVAFCSTATNLTPQGGNDLRQVYFHDLESGLTELVSVSLSGELGDGECFRPCVSADGRFVAFRSEATNLVPGGLGVPAVYLRDRLSRTTTLVSGASAGDPPSVLSFAPAMSADGRYVVFYSYLQNLVPDDGNPTADVFLWDRETGTIEVVSLTDVAGGPANGSCSGSQPALTPDGRFVVFVSAASNLVANDVDGVEDVFLRDRQTGRTELISVATTGVQGDAVSGDDAYTLAISDDGSRVAFASLAGNLAPGDTNGAWDVFVRDRQWGTTERVSVSAIGGIGNEDSGYSGLSMSADGVFIAFSSAASDLVASDTNGYSDVFVRGPAGNAWGPALVVQGGDTFTSTQAVQLTIEPAGCTELRFRDSSGEWTTWEPSATTRDWLLPAGDGLKTVVGQGRYPDLTLSEEFADTIVLDTTTPPTPAITINGGAEMATDLRVVLSLQASDAAEVRLHNESGAWSGWQYFTPTKPWVLLPGNGVKRVYAQTRDGAGNLSPEAWDEILLDVTVPSDLSIAINGGATYAASRDVQLTLTSTGAADMRFRNESADWSGWEPVAATKAWTLSGDEGTRIVFFQVRDAIGTESIQAWDDIVLDTSPPSGLHININDSDADTLSHRVTLVLLAADAAAMRFRNESGPWSEWEPYATTKVWMLSAVDGTKTVGFQCRDEAGNLSDEATDIIVLRSFDDVASDFWAYREIRACVDAGLVVGYWDDTYRPQLGVTRDQMAAYIARAVAGGDEAVPEPESGASPTFADVGTDHWAYRYVEYCYANDIIQGYWNGYRPDEMVNRGQMAVYIARAIATPTGDAGVPPATTVTFPDVTADDDWAWCYKYVEYCAAADVVQGYWDGYHPEREVTRDQMAVYIQRAFDLPM